MSPTFRVAGSTGAIVHSCPDSIRPFMDRPIGRNETVCPERSIAIWRVAPTHDCLRAEKTMASHSPTVEGRVPAPARSRCLRLFMADEGRAGRQWMTEAEPSSLPPAEWCRSQPPWLSGIRFATICNGLPRVAPTFPRPAA
jgi:hypothetical protein